MEGKKLLLQEEDYFQDFMVKEGDCEQCDIDSFINKEEPKSNKKGDKIFVIENDVRTLERMCGDLVEICHRTAEDIRVNTALLGVEGGKVNDERLSKFYEIAETLDSQDYYAKYGRSYHFIANVPKSSLEMVKQDLSFFKTKYKLYKECRGNDVDFNKRKFPQNSHMEKAFKEKEYQLFLDLGYYYKRKVNGVLMEYKRLYNEIYMNGLSLQKYADKYLESKSKKTIENKVNKMKKLLAMEYEKDGRFEN